jgi:carbamoyltransferase
MIAILGINAFHADAAACLVIDGQLVGAVAEERLGNRIKHSAHFPENAIRRLLADSNLRIKDITHVAIARDASANLSSKINYSLRNPLSSSGAIREFFLRSKRAQSIQEIIAKICFDDVSQAKFKTVNVEHHLAHIASAYYLSPFDSLTAGFSYDGSGDFASMMAARCEGNSIEVLDRVCLPNSLGFFYTALCQFIGFERFGEEYKVMGLAPYGHDVYRDEMQSLIKKESDKWFSLNQNFFQMHKGGKSGGMSQSGEILIDKFYSPEMAKLFGGAPRERQEEPSQREMDIAKSTQVRFEEIAIHCMTKLNKLVPTNNLAMAGGCALNGVTNARIIRETPFRNQFIQPASSDDGTCLGAAYHTWHQVLGMEARFEMQHAFWGPEYSKDEIENVIKAGKYSVKSFESDEDLVIAVAQLIKAGLVVGWYQGRSEWGPRALGHRSILADPSKQNMKDIINSKIKRRESFRPFAPSVLREDVGQFFEQDITSPFMMHVVKIRPEWRDRLPAVTHVDGTGRLQTVDKKSNPLYYKLIAEFKSQTGIGMLLNTSFNENEPVVDSPQQAYDCFARTEMDAICLGRYIVLKK